MWNVKRHKIERMSRLVKWVTGSTVWWETDNHDVSKIVSMEIKSQC